MDIRELRTFIAVAQTGNITRAAEELHISQPALSRQIIKLENELGCKLLERGGAMASPSPTRGICSLTARESSRTYSTRRRRNSRRPMSPAAR